MHTDMDYDSFLADDFALGVPRERQGQHSAEVILYAMALSDYPWVSTRLGACKMYELLSRDLFLSRI